MDLIKEMLGLFIGAAIIVIAAAWILGPEATDYTEMDYEEMFHREVTLSACADMLGCVLSADELDEWTRLLIEIDRREEETKM